MSTSSLCQGVARKPTRQRAYSDPFSMKHRENNFPSLEEVFLPHQRSLLDQDISMDSADSSEIFSIGARAALNDHLRHVARFGFDLDDDDVDEPSCDSRPSSIRNPLDLEWDRLAEDTMSFLSSSNQSDGDTQMTDRIVTEHRQGQESVEVMGETSSDYFNSSRVLLLCTPDKNKCFQPKILGRGEQMMGAGSTSGSTEESSPKPPPSPNSFSLSPVSESLPFQNEPSFASLSDVHSTNSDAGLVNQPIQKSSRLENICNDLPGIFVSMDQDQNSIFESYDRMLGQCGSPLTNISPIKMCARDSQEKEHLERQIENESSTPDSKEMHKFNGSIGNTDPTSSSFTKLTEPSTDPRSLMGSKLHQVSYRIDEVISSKLGQDLHPGAFTEPKKSLSQECLVLPNRSAAHCGTRLLDSFDRAVAANPDR